MAIKLETRVKDLKAYLEIAKLRKDKATARTKAQTALVTHGVSGETLLGYRQAYFDLVIKETELSAKFDRLPSDRRKYAGELRAWAETYSNTVAQRGAHLSGSRKDVGTWGATSKAESFTTVGEPYSRNCKYERTDITHRVTLDPAGVPLLYAVRSSLLEASWRDGLFLIALYPGDAAVWVNVSRGKLETDSGWVLYDATSALCSHSTISREHAVKGLAKKVKLFREEQAMRDPKIQRRLKLIARLCDDTMATFKDARGIGYCEVGIAAFQARFGIGDTASLPELVKTGDPSAIRLALHLAKKIHFKNQITQ